MSFNFDIYYTAQSNTGLVRENNEDNLFINGAYIEAAGLLEPFQSAGHASGDAALFSVCDGMGGEAFGEEASLLAVKTMEKHRLELLQISAGVESLILNCINDINDRICELITRNGKRMGTTLALLAFKHNKISIANVGDSRVYLYRNGDLNQISVDHTHTQTLIRSKIITPEEANTHHSRNKLTQHLGIFRDELIIEPYILLEQDIFDEDIWLICSDGLTDMLNNQEIKDIFSQYNSTAETGNKLVESALHKGGSDNVSIIVLKADKRKHTSPKHIRGGT